MALREQDKHFLSALYSALAIILVWKGIWEGIYNIPYINDPFVFLFLGLALLTFSGLIFKEFDPLGTIQKAEEQVFRKVFHHPQRHQFQIKYHDKSTKKEVVIEAKHLLGMEKDSLVMALPGKKQEVFIPFHRVTEILHQGKQYWRL